MRKDLIKWIFRFILKLNTCLERFFYRAIQSIN